MGIWEIGGRVVDAIGQTAPQCIVSELVATFLQPQFKAERRRRQPQQVGRMPTLTKTANQAIIGGIAIRLLDMAHHHIEERAHGRQSSINEDAIRREALAGVTEGQHALLTALNEHASTLRAAHDGLKNQLESSGITEIPIHADLGRRS
jgi:hypothetical protein